MSTDDIKLGFLGFPTHEQEALARILMLAGRAVPRHSVVDDISQANLVLINGDARQIIRFFIKVRREQKALVIGSDSYGSGLPMCPRPVRAMELVKSLRYALTTPIATFPVDATASIFAPSDVKVSSTTVETTVSTDQTPPDSPSQPPVHSLITDPALEPSPAAEAAMEDIARRAQEGEAYDALVVDDSDVAALALSARLRKMGLAAQEARSGEDALVKVGAHEFKIVFLDVMMADLDGYAVCRTIKRNKTSGKRTPRVVMVTSRGGTVDKIRAKIAGCDGYLTKPLAADDLRRTLRRFDLSL